VAGAAHATLVTLDELSEASVTGVVQQFRSAS
jgi:hypothetical protein